MSVEYSRPLKVLIIDLSKRYGGSSTRVLSLLQEFRDIQIGLVGLQASPVTRAAKARGYIVYPIAKYKFDPRILIRLVRLIRQNDIQLIDTHNIQSKFWGFWAVIFTKTALVSTIHSWYAHEHGKDSLRGKIYTQIELLTNKYLDHYITVSQKDRMMLLKSGIPEEMVTLIYNAVSFDVSGIPDISSELRNIFTLPEDAILCTCVGRLVPIKGIDLMIKAIGDLSAENPRLYGFIVGDGELYPHLNQLIADAGLDGRIFLFGHQDRDRVLSIVKASNIFLMPSYYEGTPIALLEAALLGKTIIASRTGGIPELVTHGEQAMLTPPGDFQAIAEAIRILTKDSGLADRLGAKAQERIYQDFNLKKMASETAKAYHQAYIHHRTLLKDKRNVL